MNPTKPILCLGCFFATAALAQPDVQLYGKVDLAVQYTKNPGKDAVVNLQNETSRWGLLIREDLNADWAVKAYLEAGFNANDGSEATKGVAFNRRSILAVYNKTIGEIGFGRMGTVQSISSPYGIGLPNLDPFRTAYGPAYEIEGSFGGDGRVNNAVTWLSNKMKGLQIGISYSLGVESDE
ncbi:porin, partial [Parasutterella excrementihominis]